MVHPKLVYRRALLGEAAMKRETPIDRPARECLRCGYKKWFHGNVCLACARSLKAAAQLGLGVPPRRCTKCQKFKHVADFWKDGARLHSECKACRYMKGREHLGRPGWRGDKRGFSRKTCCRCRESKYRSEFSRLSRNADGLAAACRSCLSFGRALRAGKVFDSRWAGEAQMLLVPQRRMTIWLRAMLPRLAADFARSLGFDSLPSPADLLSAGAPVLQTAARKVDWANAETGESMWKRN